MGIPYPVVPQVPPPWVHGDLRYREIWEPPPPLAWCDRHPHLMTLIIAVIGLAFITVIGLVVR